MQRDINTEIFNKSYSVLILFAEKAIKNFNQKKLEEYHIFPEPEDLVADAYIYLHNKLIEGELITIEQLQKEIINEIYLRYYYTEEKIRRDQKGNSRKCSLCQENKSVKEFGSTYIKRIKANFYQRYCKSCAQKWMADYVENNRDKWNDYVRGRKILKGKLNSDLPKYVYKFHTTNKYNLKKPYYSMIQRKGQSTVWVGTFATPEEAATACQKKLNELATSQPVLA